MTRDEEILLSNVQTRVRQLILQDQRLKQRCSTMEQQVEQLNQRIASLQEELRVTKANYANLKIAKTMELTENDSRAAHRRLNNLVRQVDECIALLQAK